MTIVPPLLSTSVCSSLVGLSQKAYCCRYYGDGYSWATKDWGYFFALNSKSSHQNVLGRRQTILQTLSMCCNAVIPLEYSNKMTQTFFFSNTQCASAPLGSWWSETWHISSEVERLGLGSIEISAKFCKYIMVQLVWEDYCSGNDFFWSYAPLGLLRSLSSPSLTVSTKFQDVYFSIISVLFQWHMEGLCTKLAQFAS